MSTTSAQPEEVELSPLAGRTPSPAVSPGSEDAGHLVELLTRASDVIREERAKVAALRAMLGGLVEAHAADVAAGRIAATSSTARLLDRERGALEMHLGPLPTPPAATSPAPPPLAPPSPAPVAAASPSAAAGPAVGDQTAAMAHRLRRALAPAPSRAQLGEVVDAMVSALQADLAARRRADGDSARTLALKRVEPCTYRVFWGSSEAVREAQETFPSHRTSSRAPPPYRTRPRCRDKLLHLSIDSGKLTVLAGGGHVDFLEYVEKNLHIKL